MNAIQRWVLRRRFDAAVKRMHERQKLTCECAVCVPRARDWALPEGVIIVAIVLSGYVLALAILLWRVG